jgi:aminoglycoside phosphotransferase family enzyme/predicted kinase
MDLESLIAALSDPAAYPHSVGMVEVRQTHVSAVFLAGPFAYKVKKPVDLGFLDFLTLDRRRHFAEEEVRLNRRLAPSVYLGVVPIGRIEGRVAIEGPGEVVEWAVKMVRLPDEATLRARLRRGELDGSILRRFARRIADFHASAESGPHVSVYAGPLCVAVNAFENLIQAGEQLGTTISRAVADRLASATCQALTELRPLIEGRAARGVPRDTHGDLRLDHVYLLPDRPPPDDLVIIDCIEFDERYRCADPMADVAFLAMDLAAHGRRDLARAFVMAYVRASGDDEGPALLPFYTSYRAAVRAKVEGLKLAEPEVPQVERDEALRRARAHWLLALVELEPPSRRPCLVLVGGLPGSGKSTLARGLVEYSGFEVIRSDVVRKELAGLSEREPASAPFGAGLYTPEWNRRTYAECLSRAERRLFEGARVVVDASFRAEADRRAFLDAAVRWGVPGVFLQCEVSEETARARLTHRHSDASDADASIRDLIADQWEPLGAEVQRQARTIANDGTAEEALALALDALRDWGLHE